VVVNGKKIRKKEVAAIKAAQTICSNEAVQKNNSTMKVVQKNNCAAMKAAKKDCRSRVSQIRRYDTKLKEIDGNIFLRFFTNVITVSIYRLFYNLIKERNNR